MKASNLKKFLAKTKELMMSKGMSKKMMNDVTYNKDGSFNDGTSNPNAVKPKAKAPKGGYKFPLK